MVDTSSAGKQTCSIFIITTHKHLLARTYGLPVP